MNSATQTLPTMQACGSPVRLDERDPRRADPLQMQACG